MPTSITAVSFVATALAALPAAARAQGAPFCLKNESGAVNCAYHSMILCEQAKQAKSRDQCIPRFQADETTGSSGAPLGSPRQPAPSPRPVSRTPAR